MPPARLRCIVEHFAGSADGLPDDRLLAAYVRDRDESAFAELVRRHGPMVLAACHRVTGRAHDAEDAFQATFLVLARRAADVWPRSAVGGWLHGVAVRTALKARSRAVRARPVPEVAAVTPDPVDPDALRFLDEEITRLPDALRLAVVLCELQGVSRREAARQLGVAEGTLSSRLATARKRLAARLSARGITLSLGGLAATAVPSALAESAVSGVVGPAVLSLTDEVMKAMFLTKLKSVTVAVMVAVAGGVWATAGAGGSPQPDPQKPEAKKAQPAAKDPAWEAFDKLVAADGDWKKEKPALDELKALGAKAKFVLEKQAEDHPKDRVRLYCYELLTEQFPDDQRVRRTVLVYGLSDKSERIRYTLAFWVGEKKIYDAHRRLRHMLDDKVNDDRTKLAAAKSLAQLGEGDMLRRLYYGLESDWYMERMMANAGIKALTGKDLNAFGGYDWREGAAVSGGAEGVGPFDPIEKSGKRIKRYTAIKAFFEWVKADRPDLYKHVSGAF